MQHIVKLKEFYFDETKGPEVVEQELAQLLDEGYMIVSQSQDIRGIFYTLVKRNLSRPNLTQHIVNLGCDGHSSDDLRVRH